MDLNGLNGAAFLKSLALVGAGCLEINKTQSKANIIGRARMRSGLSCMHSVHACNLKPTTDWTAAALVGPWLVFQSFDDNDYRANFAR